MSDFRLLIDGKLVAGADELNVINPATEEVFARAPKADLAQLEPDIAKVSFTGSTATGKRVMASASGSLKRLTLELGGNDAAIARQRWVTMLSPSSIAGSSFTVSKT